MTLNLRFDILDLLKPSLNVDYEGYFKESIFKIITQMEIGIQLFIKNSTHVSFIIFDHL